VSVKIRFDDIKLEATPRFVAALIELMQAHCAMMAQAEPEYAHCWTWGRCRVEDVSSNGGTTFEYGGEEDAPSDGLGAFAVVSLFDGSKASRKFEGT
jgi:hypothetical protein